MATNKNKNRPLDEFHVRALNQAGERRRIERMEARINQMLTLLAEKPLYRDDLAKKMGISLFTLYYVTRYAKEQGWVVSQGKYYLNPNNIMVVGGKVIRFSECRKGANV